MGTRQDLNTAHLVLNFSRESSTSIQHPVPKGRACQLPGNALIGLRSALGLGANQIKRAIRPQSCQWHKKLNGPSNARPLPENDSRREALQHVITVAYPT